MHANDTGWRIFGGDYQTESGFQVIPDNVKPIMWQGDTPPCDADGHIYAITRGHRCIILSLLREKPDLACGGIKVQAPIEHVCFDHTRLYKNLVLFIKLKS